MQYIGSFNTFNPLSGYFSSPYSELYKSRVNLESDGIHFPLILDWMAGRAQKIIKERELEEIENALNTINYFLYLANEEHIPPIDSTDPIEIHVHNSINHVPKKLNTPARLLSSQLAKICIDDDELFPNAKWEEYFAILALAALGDIHRFHQSDNELFISTIGLAAEAMEALVFAESPEFIEPLLSQSEKKKTSIRNSANAREGHAALNKWKDRFRTWVLEYYVPSLNGKPLVKRKAAKEFINTILDPEIEAGLDPEFVRPEYLNRVLADSLASDPRFKNM